MDLLGSTNVRWGGKDGKWRWLACVMPENDLHNVVGERAGEERRLADALMAAANAVEELMGDGVR